jgi:hypothetical protein
MERMMSRQTSGGQNPMDQFLTQMGNQGPGDNNGLAGGPQAGGMGQSGAPRPDQNKPLAGDPSNGPLPGMLNTHTADKVGPQSQSQGHAGTVGQPQSMPPEPTGSSMPDISGQGQPTMPGATAKTPFQWSPEDFDLGADGGEAGGASAAPPTHAGAPTQPGPDEGKMPTPGSTDSSPPTENPGPSTDDNNPAAGALDGETALQNAGADSPPAGGQTPDEVALEEQEQVAKKSFNDWLFGQ